MKGELNDFDNPDQLKILKECESELQKLKNDPENYPGFSIMIVN